MLASVEQSLIASAEDHAALKRGSLRHLDLLALNLGRYVPKGVSAVLRRLDWCSRRPCQMLAGKRRLPQPGASISNLRCSRAAAAVAVAIASARVA